MWSLTKITISNIISFQEATFEVTQGVATLIFGRNEDNAAQPNNGSGKSSLIEAISFALTGEPLRKVKSAEEIINDLADTAKVEIVLSNSYNSTILVISRTISRRSAQIIECHKYDSNGIEIELDKTIQPSVADYNKFILDEIGLTKDDIYNNYILCDNRYESFFDSSDRNKKEVINRFSNGVLVDAGLARILVDKMPIESDLALVKSEVININGSISAIEQELQQADIKSTNAKAERDNRIQLLEEKILNCRQEIETFEERKKKATERINLLKELREGVSDMLDDGDNITETYRRLLGICTRHDLGAITDYEQSVSEYKEKVAHLQLIHKEKESLVSNLNKEIEDCKEKYNALQKGYQCDVQSVKEASDADNANIHKINKLIADIDRNLDSLEAEIDKNKMLQSEIAAKITHNTTLLSGAVTCPKCAHQFIASSGVSASEIEKNINDLQISYDKAKAHNSKLSEECDKLDSTANEYEKQVEEIKKTIQNRNADLDSRYNELKHMSDSINRKSSDLLDHQKKLSDIDNELSRVEGNLKIMRDRMFGEVFNLIEGRLSSGKQYLAQQESSITFKIGQIEQYRQSKRDLIATPDIDFAASLKESLTVYKAKLKDAQKDVDKHQKEYDRLLEQEAHFTMFKSYLARKKIEALSQIVNDFLEKIGSDIRLRLEGYSVTKSGKLRDKISVQVTRDGIDCGSYHKFSGGERARLNLACILSLHTLTNSNCEDGKGLDFLIIDEVLDKSDEMGMATYCDALNKLGQTALLITQGNVAESYPHKLLIVKKQGISSITT